MANPGLSSLILKSGRSAVRPRPSRDGVRVGVIARAVWCSCIGHGVTAFTNRPGPVRQPGSPRTPGRADGGGADIVGARGILGNAGWRVLLGEEPPRGGRRPVRHGQP
jgi:hypothetical protein